MYKRVYMTFKNYQNIKIYEEVIQNLCDLFTYLGIANDPIKIYETYRFMYTSGFLSLDKSYSDNVSEECIELERQGYIPMDITGMIVLNGYGICRHTTDFLYHIYQRLGYSSSQLFTYHPNIFTTATVQKSPEEFPRAECQKYIDKVMIDVNLLGKEEQHVQRNFGDIQIKIDYYPPENRDLSNHTVNIVIDKKKVAHILDTRSHCVGEAIDKKIIRLNDQGLVHTDFIQKRVTFNTYYNTNYYRGLQLLEYSTDIEKDISDSMVYRDLCQENLDCYERFYQQNKENYNRVAKNMNTLVKRL